MDADAGTRPAADRCFVARIWTLSAPTPCLFAERAGDWEIVEEAQAIVGTALKG